MKQLLIILLLLSTSIFSQSFDSEKSYLDTNLSTPSKIEYAYAKKQITMDERILFLTYFLKDSRKVPQKYRSNYPEKCGTWIILTIQNNIDNISTLNKSIIKKYGLRVN